MPAANPPPKDTIPALHPILDSVPLDEMCATCRFWFRENQIESPHGNAAMCRRFPGHAVLVPLPKQAQLDPRAPGFMPQVLPVMKIAGDWCGEYELETRASAYAQPERKGGSA